MRTNKKKTDKINTSIELISNTLIKLFIEWWQDTLPQMFASEFNESSSENTYALLR